MDLRSLRRLLLATSFIAAMPVVLGSIGCRPAQSADDYEEDEDRPRKKHKKHKKQDDDEQWDNGGNESRGGGRTWYCAPSDVTACFETPAACRDRAKYLQGQPTCYTAKKVFCYTHDLYLNATYACFATPGDCQGDQSIAKNQENKNMGTYYNVSACQAW
jgi:Ni/Co efflux regulator RcnB